MNKFKPYKNLLAFIFLLAPLIASAQTNNQANIQVTATVQSACNISAEPISFGNYDPLSKDDLNAQGAVIMDCVAGVAPKIYLGRGINFKDGDRQMLGPNGELLKYKLFQPDIEKPSSCTLRNKSWGNTSGDRLVTTTTTIKGKTTYAVCGVIPNDQSPTEGAYSDTVSARFDFLP